VARFTDWVVSSGYNPQPSRVQDFKRQIAEKTRQ
jgi:hypothetical protein